MRLNSLEDYEFLKENVLNKSDLTLVTFVNAFSYFDFKERFINDFDFIFSDGMLLTLFERYLKGRSVSRLSFDNTSIAPDFFNWASSQKLSVSAVGGSSSESNKFEKYLNDAFPCLKVKFSHSGFFESNRQRRMVLNKAVQSDILVVGMGFPLQEEFCRELRDLCSNTNQNLRLAITCGGFITQQQSLKDYYPKWVNKLHLRWFFRLVTQGHVRKKFLKKYPHFIIRYLTHEDF